LDVGETVQFITGKGPVMTVTEVLTEVKDIGIGVGNVRCKWWDDTEKKFKEYYFMTKELRSYEEGPPVRVGGHRST